MKGPEPDEQLMRRAIELSKRGYPAPNPHVGCVLESGGEIVGEGFHAYAGAPHAEVDAIQNWRSRGSPSSGVITAYVTLEPCNHFGRTGPCSKALIEAGVERVVIACSDPNPKAMGGAQALRQAGVHVVEGFLAGEAELANEQFLTAMRRQRPFVVVKAAISLDGRVALASGESQWITGEAARTEGHRLRAQLGAVLVGSGTVKADNPRLTARIPGVVNQPLRVVLDPESELTGSEHVFDEEAETLWLVRTRKNARQTEVESSDGLFSPELVLAKLWERGCTGVLIEGGPRTIGSFIRGGAVDRFELFLAPKLLGNGPAWYQNEAVSSLSEALFLQWSAPRFLDGDLWLSARPTIA